MLGKSVNTKVRLLFLLQQLRSCYKADAQYKGMMH